MTGNRKTTRPHMCHRWTGFFLLVLLFMFAGRAKADVCSAAMSDISFGSVSPVSGQDYFAIGTLSITCTFVLLNGNIALLPNVNICANLGPGSGAIDVSNRRLSSGTNKIRFNLYRAATYVAADIWGGYENQTAISSSFTGLLAVGTNTLTYPVYAKISAADLAGIPSIGDMDTNYNTSFAGAGNILYSSGSIVVSSCQTSGQTAPFSFSVRANVINDCNITTTSVSFGAIGTLTATTRALGSLGVKCTAGSSYRIALNSGQAPESANVRRMRNAATGETVRYSLSTTLDGPEWGDATAGSRTYDATGTGFSQNVVIYGRVPGQATPSPGDYSDRVTATVYF